MEKGRDDIYMKSHNMHILLQTCTTSMNYDILVVSSVLCDDIWKDFALPISDTSSVKYLVVYLVGVMLSQVELVRKPWLKAANGVFYTTRGKPMCDYVDSETY